MPKKVFKFEMKDITHEKTFEYIKHAREDKNCQNAQRQYTMIKESIHE
jgi:hypothetical protein